jgi:hypothetical protein
MINMICYVSDCAAPAALAAAHWLAPQPPSCSLAERSEGIAATSWPETARPE